MTHTDKSLDAAIAIKRGTLRLKDVPDKDRGLVLKALRDTNALRAKSTPPPIPKSYEHAGRIRNARQ